MTDNPSPELEGYLRRLAVERDAGPALPDPDLIWWKAEVRRRFEARQDATRSIHWMEQIGYGSCALAATVIVAVSRRQLYRTLEALDQSHLLSFAELALLTVAAAALVALWASRTEE